MPGRVLGPGADRSQATVGGVPLRIQETSDRGMALVSLAALAPGDLALCEVPALALVQGALAPTLQDLQRWTDRFAALEEEARRRILSLCCHAGATEGGALEALLGRCGERLPELISCPEAVGVEDVWQFLRILESNAFQNPVTGGGFRIELLPVAARLNHSCLPNALHGPGQVAGTVEVRALRAVAEGEELTISYVDEATLLSPTSARRSVLRHWQFHCSCPRCAGPDLPRGFRCLAGDCPGMHCAVAELLEPCDQCGHHPVEEEAVQAFEAERALGQAVAATADAGRGSLDSAAAAEVLDACRRAAVTGLQAAVTHHLQAGLGKATAEVRARLGDGLAGMGYRAAAEVLWKQAATELRCAMAAEQAALPVPHEGQDDDLLRLAALYQRLGKFTERRQCLSLALDIIHLFQWACATDARREYEEKKQRIYAALGASR